MNVDIVIFMCRAISWACSMGSRECQAQAGDLFSRWMEADSPDTSQDNPWVMQPYILQSKLCNYPTDESIKIIQIMLYIRIIQ